MEVREVVFGKDMYAMPGVNAFGAGEFDYLAAEPFWAHPDFRRADQAARASSLEIAVQGAAATPVQQGGQYRQENGYRA